MSNHRRIEVEQLRAEVEQLRAKNGRLSAMVAAGFAMYDDKEARDVVDAEAIAKPIMVLTSEVERLRAALREHHADIGVRVHDQRPCSICNVDA